MARIAVKLEDKFVDLAYKLGNVDGLDAAEVKAYIRYITDRRLLQLGLKTNFKVKVPAKCKEGGVGGAAHDAAARAGGGARRGHRGGAQPAHGEPRRGAAGGRARRPARRGSRGARRGGDGAAGR